ncbi:Lrp/AsnC family transcriptional regulator [Naumannella halotolerans]|uniref:DNA-binding Lrp family transcriptional regulator n=1 Tax=Naumannella halotolerans TaxID=993414 RepID=A0A4R7J1S6_9ACTN|nr:Lrp/AsnC family transcriptional regulator [Naumannella halotolerans]TDT31024.1 DNA-binding Lrp family transcriptional regulator [Naumannella halotolerans]
MALQKPVVPGSPKDVRPAPSLDRADTALVERLATDARATNAELASAAGVAPSTAHTRVRGLQDRGVITSYHAAVDQAALGNTLQAMIGVTLRPGMRQEAINAFTTQVRTHPQVLQFFFLGGNDDFLVHVAVTDSSQLRRFVVDQLSSQNTVASTHTSVIFEYHHNGVAAAFS